MVAVAGSLLPLRLAAEGDVIVQGNEVEPGLHVFPLLRKFAHVLCEILKRFHVSARAAALNEIAPGIYLPCGPFWFRVRIDPGEDLSIADAGGELLLQSGEVEPDKFLEMLVNRGVVGEFSVHPG